MSLRAWLRGGSSSATPPKTASRPSTPMVNGDPAQSADQRKINDMEDALRSMGLVMNDDPEGAEAQLRERNTSSFHQLGLGVSIFIRSILGFEKDVMNEASARLVECEATAWADKAKAEKRGAVPGGQLYPPGSEFAVVYAGALLMNAIVGVLHESLTDALKGFYKLRKAYVIMNSLAAAEETIINGRAGPVTAAQTRPGDSGPSSPTRSPMPGSFDEAEFSDINSADQKPPARQGRDEDDDLDFIDAEEALSEAQTPAGYGGHLAQAPGVAGVSGSSTSMLDKKLAKLQMSSPTANSSQSRVPSREGSQPTSAPRSPALTLEPVDAAAVTGAGLFTHPIDIFCNSATNVFFGVMLLALSMVPPAFSKLLSVIGFKGDRERGIRMLWKSTAYANVNGAVAGMMILGYYHGILAFTEILPATRDVEELASEDEVVGYPQERCAALLDTMRTRYPASGMWKLEQARVIANGRRLREAADVLTANGESKMRQVAALNAFELALYHMFLLDWPRMHAAFLRMSELNDWSHTLYYYVAGCAELEMYREAVQQLARLDDAGDRTKVSSQKSELETEVRRHKKAAEELLRKAPTMAGRKRFMARQLPFEVFVIRKLAKWEERAAALGIDMVDAASPSPAVEMIYLWNGGKRMSPDVVDEALSVLEWERCTAPADKLIKIKEALDDVAVQGICRASLLRQVGRKDEAKTILQGLVSQDRALFKGGNKDDYVLPMVTYELAALAWNDVCLPEHWPQDAAEVDEYRKRKTAECCTLLETVAAWEAYVLDARFGMRVQTGLDSVRWLQAKKGWTP